jgi:hypothetical protein
MAKFALKSQKKIVSFWVHFSIKKIAKKKKLPEIQKVKIRES